MHADPRSNPTPNMKSYKNLHSVQLIWFSGRQGSIKERGLAFCLGQSNHEQKLFSHLLAIASVVDWRSRRFIISALYIKNDFLQGSKFKQAFDIRNLIGDEYSV